ncbi:hypothetical protein SpCBS45565_g05304 [Spizellomyces sp. 'palustris']|nr:hypothetical protein SpCBS45565_g05304 [Spizellomyces sp. 'palustris']
MPSFAQARACNATVNLANKRFLVVGGTSGIGQATALKLASMHASISLAGRNATAGSTLVAQLTDLNPKGHHEFLPIDMTLMKDIRRFAAAYRNTYTELNGLVISAGFMTMQGRTETVEGIDQKMAVHYYGRALLIKELLPLLETASEKGEDSRVLSIFAAGLGGPIHYEDLDLKTTYNLKTAAEATSGYNDLLVNELSLRHPSIGFMHIAPGVIETPLMKNLPLYLRVPAKILAKLVANSPEECAEIMTYALTSDQYKTGWWLLSDKGVPLKPQKYHTDEAREAVWKHTNSVVS